MSIVVLCDQCKAQAEYTVTPGEPNYGASQVILKTSAIVSEGERHVCDKVACLLQELWHVTHNWSRPLKFKKEQTHE